MSILYAFFRGLFGIGIRFYFKSIRVHWEERIPPNVPIIIAANHNSAVMDPIVLSVLMNRPVWFLARGETFSNGFRRWFFRALNMLPVYRPEQAAGQVHLNRHMFAACTRLLAQKKSLVFFPEATSEDIHYLRPFRTGMARAALLAEAEHNFELGVCILPVGINYSNSHRFRSQLFLSIGKPVRVSSYKDLYQADKNEAVDKLTTVVHEALEKELVIAKDKEALAAINLLGSQVEAGWNSIHAFRRRQQLARQVMTAQDSGQWATFQAELEDFCQHLGDLPADDDLHTHLYPGWEYLKTSLIALVGFPLFLYGFINTCIPMFLGKWFADRFTKKPDFYGSLLFITGTFSFLFFGIVQTVIVILLTNIIIGLMYLALLLPAGLFASEYRYYIKSSFKHLHMSRVEREALRKTQSHLAGKLATQTAAPSQPVEAN